MATTLAAVFAPIGFTGGLTGSLFTEFAFTLVFTVAVSTVVALTLSPMVSSRVLRTHAAARPRARLEAGYARLRAVYDRSLGAVMRYRGAVLVVAAGRVRRDPVDVPRHAERARADRGPGPDPGVGQGAVHRDAALPGPLFGPDPQHHGWLPGEQAGIRDQRPVARRRRGLQRHDRRHEDGRLEQAQAHPDAAAAAVAEQARGPDRGAGGGVREAFPAGFADRLPGAVRAHLERRLRHHREGRQRFHRQGASNRRLRLPHQGPRATTIPKCW